MNVENENASFWGTHFAAWQTSGLSQRAYCERQGLSYSAFGYWRSRVKGAAPPPPPAFVPVLVEPPGAEAEGAAAKGGLAAARSGPFASLEIRLSHGRSVLVSGDFDEALLARVIRAVERAPC